jgi:hypothetical protein
MNERSPPQPSSHLRTTQRRIRGAVTASVVSPQNKVENGVLFFDHCEVSFSCPRLPRIPPQLHHKSTTFCTPLFTKHPSKTPINNKNSPRHHTKLFLQKIEQKITRGWPELRR